MVEVPVSIQSGTIQVALPPGSQLEMVDTWNNRRLLMLLLRLLHGADGKPLMSFAAIAQAFGYKDRRNGHNFWREFEQSGQDELQYLERKYKIDQRMRETIVQVFLEDLWATVAAVTTQVRHRLELGPKDLSEKTVS